MYRDSPDSLNGLGIPENNWFHRFAVTYIHKSKKIYICIISLTYNIPLYMCNVTPHRGDVQRLRHLCLHPPHWHHHPGEGGEGGALPLPWGGGRGGALPLPRGGGWGALPLPPHPHHLGGKNGGVYRSGERAWQVWKFCRSKCMRWMMNHNHMYNVSWMKTNP